MRPIGQYVRHYTPMRFSVIIIIEKMYKISLLRINVWNNENKISDIIFIGQYFPSSRLCTTPDCTGFPDGKNIHSNRGAPYYMLCDNGRTIETGQCRSTRLDYSCYVKACTTKINRRYGAGKCENFIWCYMGTEYKYHCPAGTVFDEKLGKCEHPYYTCKPCGTKTW